MQTNPLSPEQEFQEARTIQTYDQYAKSWVNDHTRADDYAAILAKLKELVPAGDVIDVGCGGGQGADILAPLSYTYLGVDASAGMIAEAKHQHPELTFEAVNLYDLAKLGRQFEVFWCSAVLLHIPKSRIDEALRAISSIVKSGGAGFISLKDGDTEDFEERTVGDRQESRIFAYWQKAEFESALQRNGFEIAYYNYHPLNERSKWHRFVVRKATDS